MKKLNILNTILKIMIVLCIVFIVGAVVYQNTMMEDKTEVVAEETTEDGNVVDNGDGTHTHTYTDENGETHEETHDNIEE